MKADYKNWVLKGMVHGLDSAAVGLAGVAAGVGLFGKNTVGTVASAVLGTGALGCGTFTAWCVHANGQFSYDGERKLPKQIVRRSI